MRTPTGSEIADIADCVGIPISDSDLEEIREQIESRLGPIERIRSEPNPRDPAPVRGTPARGPGYQPGRDEDPHNAWITRCDVSATSDGPLAEMAIGLKDNISVAGIPLTNGSRLMDGYIPRVDATIVSRLLDAGGAIAGKNNMWSFSIGPSDFGQVTNPHYPDHTIAGSSSGTAAAVASEEVDVGIGGDQGGSIRIPSAFAGLVGIKPTHGLVPYTGILGADPSIDHTGPISRTVRDAAATLDVIAGRDALDPSQPHDLTTTDYPAAIEQDVSNLSIGILREGFEIDGHDPGVNASVRSAIESLESAGVDVSEISLPEHELAADVGLAIVRLGYGRTLRDRGMTYGHRGWNDVGALAYLNQALSTNPTDLPSSAKTGLLLSEYIHQTYGGGVYAEAHNLARELQERYDRVLSEVDALVMPTVPVLPPETNGGGPSQSAGASIIGANTVPFNATQHPAMTVPCSEHVGAPVGMMLVGKRFDESTLIALGAAHESAQA